MSSMQPIVQVDAFAERPFEGNPAAVCVMQKPAPEAWMRQVAAEMNLSETAFVTREEDDFRLRWFTPAVEVDLCGHATLAAAHALWEEGYLKPKESAHFRTRSGPLVARRCGEGIEMDFPAEPAAEAEAPEALAASLGVEPAWIGRNRMDYLALVESEAALRRLEPDFRRMRDVEARGVIVTAPAAGDEFDFVSRFFAPLSGVDEDPVTGSAHCCLGPFWAGRLGRNDLTGWQASTRGGRVGVRVEGERVHLTGRAVTVLRGEIVAAETAPRASRL